MSARDLVRRLPKAPGVYRFRDATGKVLYIGRATDLRSRVGSYWGDLGDRRHLKRMVPLIARVEAVECASVHEAAWLERNLLVTRKPRWNRARGGAESETHLVVDTRPRRPGITVGYDRGPLDEGVLRFGPYLGGARSRSALGALRRVRPLGFTGTHLTPAERDLAAKRGVGEADREALVAELVALLDRDPAAVERCTADLVAARTRAAESLAFELAAQIQEELEAIAWLTCVQRVATLDPTDAAVCGWSDGTLVTFTVRAGQLTGWKQERCVPARGAALVEATTEAWRPFAAAAADLARSLSEPAG